MERLYTAYPLDHLREQIRLFTIFPDPWDYEIRGTFSVVSLRRCPEYIALSYVWGDALRSFTIYVEGQPVPISQNLHAALLRLRWHAYQHKRPRS